MVERRWTWSHVARLVVIGASLAVGASLSVTTPAYGNDRFAKPKVAVIGDSYISGEGYGAYAPMPGQPRSCHQSLGSYGAAAKLPNGKSADRGSVLRFAACSGATIDDIMSNTGKGAGQLAKLDADTDYVLLSAGGNDAGFQPIASACILGFGPESACDTKIDVKINDSQVLQKPLTVSAPQFANATIESKLPPLLRQISARAKNARVYLVGYPSIFSGPLGFCERPITKGEQQMLMSLNKTVVDAQRRVVASVQRDGMDVIFVDTWGPFGDRGACNGPANQYIHYIPKPPPEIMHPNVRGWNLLTDIVSDSTQRPERRINKFLVQDAMFQRYMQLDGPYGFVGVPTSERIFGLRDGGKVQRFSGANLYETPTSGVRFVRGAIMRKYGELDWERSFLRYPTTDESCGIKNGGCYQHFQGGSIYYSPATGAKMIRGSIRERWKTLGWENSFLGYPTSDEICGLKEGGCYQTFQGGYIYYSPKTGSRYVRGAIMNRWSQMSRERSHLGYPTTDESCGIKDNGCYQHFQGGSIYYSPATGAQPISGLIRNRWASMGWERSSLGYPTGPERDVGPPEPSFCQPFQNGSIYRGRAPSTATMVTSNRGCP